MPSRPRLTSPIGRRSLTSSTMRAPFLYRLGAGELPQAILPGPGGLLGVIGFQEETEARFGRIIFTG